MPGSPAGGRRPSGGDPVGVRNPDDQEIEFQRAPNHVARPWPRQAHLRFGASGVADPLAQQGQLPQHIGVAPLYPDRLGPA
jgi:hypothetical protein